MQRPYGVGLTVLLKIMNQSDKERIEKEANKFAFYNTAPNEPQSYHELHTGYIAGATTQLERMAALREALKDILPIADQATRSLIFKPHVYSKFDEAIERAKKLLEP